MPNNPSIHNRKSRRLKDYDYSSEGKYFITIGVKDMECLFGYVQNGEMVMNEYGKIAREEWIK